MSPVYQTFDYVSVHVWSKGSVEYAVSPYDNYDVEAWLIVGAGINDGDDVLLGQVDEQTWVQTGTWESFDCWMQYVGTFRIGLRYHGQSGSYAGIDDVLIYVATVFDCNANGIPDDCDTFCGYSEDCNLNALPDECDIADGDSADVNSDGTPDECQSPILLFGDCMAGPDNGNPGCDPVGFAAMDREGDDDLDVRDYAQFQWDEAGR